MKLFKCDHCGQPVYFENTFCVQCNASLGFDPQRMDLAALQPAEDNSYTILIIQETPHPPRHAINIAATSSTTSATGYCPTTVQKNFASPAT
ncbi:MAG: zinc-ribbon domain-containing protein [Bacteroidota bacterium]